MQTGTRYSFNPKTIGALYSFLRIPSISSNVSYKNEVSKCAAWLAGYLNTIGLRNTSLYPTAMHPIVCSEHITNPSYPTILFYGHYDVQPPGTGWSFPPFEPFIKDGYIYGRGTADDKAQIFIQLRAIEYLLQHPHAFRVNIRCLFEGEEEIGSPGLADFIKANPSKVSSDVVIVSDTKMFSPDIPAITYSLRGALNAAIYLMNSKKELHSGTYGGMIHNPADVLSGLITSLQDDSGNIRVAGFYHNIKHPRNEELAFMNSQGPSDADLLRSAAIGIAKKEKGYSLYQQTTIRPSINVSAMQAGYTGAGVKNIIPSAAMARINMRLVNGQSCHDTAKRFAAHVKNFVPHHFRYRIRFSSMTEPVETSRRHPYVAAAARAYASAFPNPPVFLRSGGTIPVVSLLCRHISAPVILMGFALADDNIHAANERFLLRTFDRGINTLIHFMKNISAFSLVKKGNHDN